MEQIFLGVTVVSIVLISLVLVINLAESKLLPQGDVSILINDDSDSEVKTRPGSTLLSVLAGQTIFLPSACGGGGTCAMCKCQVLEGGGDILPTETGHISRSEAKDSWRLACQVKVKQNMKIHVPEEIFSIQKWEATVSSNQNVATFIKELVLDFTNGENVNFQARGYIQIDIPEYNINFNTFDVEKEYHPDWDKFKIWDLVAKNEDCLLYTSPSPRD